MNDGNRADDGAGADSQTTAVNSEATVPSPASPFKGLPGSPVHAVISLPGRLISFIVTTLYVGLQYILAYLFTPPAPGNKTSHEQTRRQPFGRIAVIGAGLTGVSSAAHCIAHGFEVVIFESKDKTGGIWADVNKCVSLSSLYTRC